MQLNAIDTDELKIIATILQDGLIEVNDVKYLPSIRSFMLMITRFMWEEKIVNKVYAAQSDTRFDITKYTTTKHEDEIFEKIIKLADKIIEANPRKNKSLEIVNQPYPLPFKINYQ